MNQLKLREILKQAFLEDIGDGDLTSLHAFQQDDMCSGSLIAKADGVVSGLDTILVGYQMLDDRITVKVEKLDGESVQKGEVIAEVSGPIQSVLAGERVILNIVQHMSGISTLTNQTILALNCDETRVCDTRKTLPGLRMIEKYAVRMGGGYNHRFGLYDGVMLKDNHIAYYGSIEKAVKTVRGTIGHMVKIEVEIETEEQVRQAVAAGADVIMFDNREPEEIKEWITIVPKNITTEASGGITIENIHRYGNLGLDYISLGALTHSVKALDISFKIRGMK